MLVWVGRQVAASRTSTSGKELQCGISSERPSRQAFLRAPRWARSRNRAPRSAPAAPAPAAGPQAAPSERAEARLVAVAIRTPAIANPALHRHWERADLRPAAARPAAPWERADQQPARVAPAQRRPLAPAAPPQAAEAPAAPLEPVVQPLDRVAEHRMRPPAVSRAMKTAPATPPRMMRATRIVLLASPKRMAPRATDRPADINSAGFGAPSEASVFQKGGAR